MTGLQPDTNAVADQLLEDIQYLADQLNAEDYTIDPTKIAGDAQGLLDEISTSKITGEEDIFSHTDLWDFQANVDGSQAAIAALNPILQERNPELAQRIADRFADLDAALAQFRVATDSCTTTPSPRRSVRNSRVKSMHCPPRSARSRK